MSAWVERRPASKSLAATKAAWSANCSPVRWLLTFVAGMMLLMSIGMGGIAHAAETSGCLDAPQAQTALHAAGDCDEVPADDHKGYPHHHAACHGHCAATPAESRVAVTLIDQPIAFEIEKTPLRIAHQGDPALRPPQA